MGRPEAAAVPRAAKRARAGATEQGRVAGPAAQGRRCEPGRAGTGHGKAGPAGQGRRCGPARGWRARTARKPSGTQNPANRASSGTKSAPFTVPTPVTVLYLSQALDPWTVWSVPSWKNDTVLLPEVTFTIPGRLYSYIR